MKLADKLAFQAPRCLGVMRAMTGLLYLQHGLQNLFQFPAPRIPQPGEQPPPPGIDPAVIAGAAGSLELVGGVLLIIGFFTRTNAFIQSGMMAIAYFMVHAPMNFYPIINGGDLAILFCFVFLYLFFAGAGEWSVDAAFSRKKNNAVTG